MDLLFRRDQTSGRMSRVSFRLWGKIELNDAEKVLLDRYRFDEKVLIDAFQPGLLRSTIIRSFVVFFFISSLVAGYWSITFGLVLGLAAAGSFGYWYANEKRETIFVRDLLHGRYFKCHSVVDLARQEHQLSGYVAILRQVMETAKHWDGVETLKIEPLPKEEARLLIAQS